MVPKPAVMEVLFFPNQSNEIKLANMIRTCNLCGARKFIMFGRCKFDKRASVGAEHYTKIEKKSATRNSDRVDFDNLTLDELEYILDENIFIQYINDNHYLPIFIEQYKFSKPATNDLIITILKRAQTLNLFPLFILGNEKYGIPNNILKTRIEIGLTYTLELKQMGCIRSYNVSNTCAILSYKIMECFDIMNINT